MRIAFAHRDHNTRSHSANALSCVTMAHMERAALLEEIRTAAQHRAAAEQAFKDADARLKALLVQGRAANIGPSEMGRASGFTREWVAKIAPEVKPSA